MKQLTELETITEIDACLMGLPPDARARALSWILSKHRVTSIHPATPILATLSTQQQSSQAAALPETIKEFISKKKPISNYEKIACCVYYLEKFQNMESVTTLEISQANLDARLPKMSSASVFVAEAVRMNGYLTSAPKGKKVLSARGEAVVNALPDRDAVEKVLLEMPFKRVRKDKSAKAGKVPQV